MKPSITPEFMARVRWHESMSVHTSWRAGGPADMFFVPRDIEDLSSFLRSLSADVPVYWVGLGSNLLVRDGGIRGVVVATAGAFTRIERRSQSRIYCQASVPCARIARACVNWGLAQAEFFGGIPGTFGGALAMNAGAFGDETWRHVLSVETIDRRGQRRERTPQDFSIAYRHVEPLDPSQRATAEEWFLSAELQFEPRTGEPRNSVRSLTERRRQTQPIGRWSCGSVFKNPPGDHAARLIDTAGLKGYRFGDAVVSDKHANFIINDGHASATELEQLIRHVQQTVARVHGVTHETEVRIVGESVAAGASADGVAS
jgi:UDP-N-acetylmuramate dehydrogenase